LYSPLYELFPWQQNKSECNPEQEKEKAPEDLSGA
jgi:hypothetical protein